MASESTGARQVVDTEGTEGVHAAPKVRYHTTILSRPEDPMALIFVHIALIHATRRSHSVVLHRGSVLGTSMITQQSL